VKTLNVRYRGWGEDWLLGQLADDGRALLFEYSPEALRQNLELSPLNVKLRAQAYGDFPVHQMRLPGFIADALPDGWGLMLMDRLFRQRNINPGPLDRLAFIADRAMGALSFEPPADAELPAEDWSLLHLAEESHRLLAGRNNEALLELLVAGGSPQGARPKALVHYDPATQYISTLPGTDGAPWLVKFQAPGEHKEVCAIEHLYAHIARHCGIEMPETAYFDLSPKYAAFGIARFDREADQRVPLLSLAALLDADFRVPAVDYTTFLRATRMLTRDEREVQKAFARAVFNVIVHNRDDHTKNFAYRLGHDRRWRLAPAYDITFSDGPRGQHQMDICGVAENVSRGQLLKLADQGGIGKKFANDIVDTVLEATEDITALAKNFAIRKTTIKQLRSGIDRCKQTVD
jgi:serine/threonine-protein kinase HipA